MGGANGRSDGFSWAGGHQPHTQGMTVWSQPFIREVDHGEGGRTKMAVLLVDTQGTFDHKMKLKLEACMFGLSTTVSGFPNNGRAAATTAALRKRVGKLITYDAQLD